MDLKYFAPYLPHGLRGEYMGGYNYNHKYEADVWTWMHFKYGQDKIEIGEFTPYLRPMSDLTKEELWAQGFECHIDYLTHEKQDPLKAPYEMVNYLFSKHFDVFGLIEKGLAIDLKTTTTEE